MPILAEIDPDAREVLSLYPRPFAAASWTALGNAGGFSGARIWRGEVSDGSRYCLRAWPRGQMREATLRRIHEALASCPLPFVAKLISAASGDTWVHDFQQFWEVTTWMPGIADFHQKPTDARLFAAMNALARIHDCWQPMVPQAAPCPAVKRIIRAVREWRSLVQSGWKPDFRLSIPDSIHDKARRGWKALLGGAVGIEFGLLDWENRLLPLQGCLCDVWHDHILYEGDAVTGVIDYGAVKLDCVAIDLARLLGSLIPDDRGRMNTALAVYSGCRAVSREVLELVPQLDRVGSVIGLANWVQWIYRDRRPLSNFDQVGRRMDALLNRIDQKKPA